MGVREVGDAVFHDRRDQSGERIRKERHAPDHLARGDVEGDGFLSGRCTVQDQVFPDGKAPDAIVRRLVAVDVAP